MADRWEPSPPMTRLATNCPAALTRPRDKRVDWLTTRRPHRYGAANPCHGSPGQAQRGSPVGSGRPVMLPIAPRAACRHPVRAPHLSANRWLHPPLGRSQRFPSPTQPPREPPPRRPSFLGSWSSASTSITRRGSEVGARGPRNSAWEWAAAGANPSGWRMGVTDGFRMGWPAHPGACFHAKAGPLLFVQSGTADYSDSPVALKASLCG